MLSNKKILQQEKRDTLMALTCIGECPDGIHLKFFITAKSITGRHLFSIIAGCYETINNATLI
jgi:hypothetical protein